MLATAEQIFENSSKISLYNKRTLFGYGLGHNQENVSFTVENIQRALDGIKQKTIAGQQYKASRPWELINPTAGLDPKQPWLGFEYETGFDSREEYQNVVNWVWNNIHGSAMDREGPGDYYVELTFSPINFADLVKGVTPVDLVHNYYESQGIAQSTEDDEGYGIHINISTPASRKLDGNQMEAMATILTAGLRNIPHAAMDKLFGRFPYGFAYYRSAYNVFTDTQDRWLEFKLFRTTDDKDQFHTYRKVIANLTKVMDYVARNKSVFFTDARMRLYNELNDSYYGAELESKAKFPWIANMAYLLSGKETVPQIELVSGEDALEYLEE